MESLARLSSVHDRQRGCGRELAIRTVAAIVVGTAGAVDPSLGAVATGSGPLLESVFLRVGNVLGRRRTDHAVETLQDAAEAAGAQTDDEFVEFVEQAVSDERKQELLTQALTIAQDTASRDKRLALGQAIAAGIADDGARVDEQQLFIRTLDDLDMPHIRLLALMTTVPRHLATAGPEQGVWMPWSISDADPGLADTVHVLLGTLERHGLVWASLEDVPATRRDGRVVLFASTDRRCSRLPPASAAVDCDEHSAGLRPFRAVRTREQSRSLPTNESAEREYLVTGYGEWFAQRLADAEYGHDDNPDG